MRKGWERGTWDWEPVTRRELPRELHSISNSISNNEYYCTTCKVLAIA